MKMTPHVELTYKQLQELADDAVHERLGEESTVVMSAFETVVYGDDTTTWIVKPAALPKGRFVVVEDGDDLFGNGRPFRSKVLEDPTWEDLVVVAHQQVKETGNNHHVFLEGWRVRPPVNDGPSELTLVMGS